MSAVTRGRWTGPWLLAGLVLMGAFFAEGFAMLAGPLEAQVVERERQESLAPALGIVEIDAGLRSRLGLFPEVQGFRVARLLLRADGSTVLELESIREGRIERERRILSAVELENLRSDLASRLELAGSVDPGSQEGRGGLVLGQTLLGLGYHGWAVPVILDVNSGQAAVASYLLTAGATFLVPYRLTRNRGVLEVHRDLAWYGGTRGIGAGLMLGDMIVDRDSSDRGRVMIAGGLLLGWGGSFGGFAGADRWLPSDGSASLWAALGDLGFAAGAASAYVAGPYASRTVTEVINPGTPEEFTTEESRTRNRPLGHAMTLAGGAAGLAAGKMLDGRIPMTEGTVTVLRSAGILGAQTGFTLGRAISDEGRVVMAGGLAGALGGTALGAPFLRERHFTNGEGLLIAAGHLGGGAFAAGVTYLILEEIDEHPVIYLATSTLGSALGSGLVFRGLNPGSDIPPLGRDARRPASERRAQGRSVEVDLNPVALFHGYITGGSLSRDAPRTTQDAGVRTRPAPPPPLVTIRF